MLAKGNLFSVSLMLAASFALGACNDQRFASQQAPDLDLPGLIDQQPYSLSRYKGQVVYLTFWASWCAPCRKEMPFLVDMYRRYSGEGFEILAVNVDVDPQAGQDFILPFNVPFPVLSDSESEALKAYRVEGMPTHFIIDREGAIRYSHMGFKEEDKKAILEKVGQLTEKE